ncbi:cation:proton antiporter subunit C [Thermococcus barophilus]|uniref:Na+/H+ antiporter, MbhG-like subunit n=1 Tax=Thermococcus barophilus TaxID=55802 RepID=A0A0S1XCJ9_THEBA|nr:cation:proton antiporter subunit C [Thermococcus barophilus]ALM75506.1 Na+/H+ antiporter, MbhG-like subunit [Thermococcus barophilus]
MINAEIAGILIMLIGLYGLMTKKDLIKQVLSVNVASTGLVLFFVGTGYIEGGEVPIMPQQTVVDPLPATLMLTTLVVDVAITSLALAIILRMRGDEM